jgi:hypothetical protein
MVDIPADIWLHIATFIPTNVLRDLISVNSILFDIGMNARYREVSINFRSDEMKMLSRIRHVENCIVIFY